MSITETCVDFMKSLLWQIALIFGFILIVISAIAGMYLFIWISVAVIEKIAS